MSWTQFFQGFFIPFRPEITISLWADSGVPYLQTFLVAACWTSITLLITYFGTDVNIRRLLKRWSVLKKPIENWEAGNISSQNDHYLHRKMRGMNVLKKLLVIVPLSFLPYTFFVPTLGTAVIVAAKLLNIRYLIIVLLLGNLFRWSIITHHLYQAFSSS